MTLESKLLGFGDFCSSRKDGKFFRQNQCIKGIRKVHFDRSKTRLSIRYLIGYYSLSSLVCFASHNLLFPCSLIRPGIKVVASVNILFAKIQFSPLSCTSFYWISSHHSVTVEGWVSLLPGQNAREYKQCPPQRPSYSIN